MRYEKTQKGWFVIGIFLSIIILMFLAYVNQWGSHPIPKVPFLIMTAVFLIPMALFYQLTICVEERTIRIIYGIGLIRKTIKPERILHVESVKIPWYAGAGIRIMPQGTLYSLWGQKVVRVDYLYKGKEKSVFIGSQEPEELKTVIDRHFA